MILFCGTLFYPNYPYHYIDRNPPSYKLLFFCFILGVLDHPSAALLPQYTLFDLLVLPKERDYFCCMGHLLNHFISKKERGCCFGYLVTFSFSNPFTFGVLCVVYWVKHSTKRLYIFEFSSLGESPYNSRFSNVFFLQCLIL